MAYSASKPWNWTHLVPIGLILGVLGLSVLLTHPVVRDIPLCFFHWLSGWDCPGCGLTRAFISLFHGEFRRAIAYNALAPVLAIWLLLYLIYHLAILSGRGFRWESTPVGRKWISISFIVLFAGQWAWKLWQHW